MLAAKGAKVAAVDIIDFTPSHPNIKAYKCDISQFDEITRVQAEIRKDWDGEVTMVANIAGLNNRSLILDLDERKVNRMIDVNLKSREYATRKFCAVVVSQIGLTRRACTQLPFTRSAWLPPQTDFWSAIVFLPAMVKAGRGHFLSVASTMGLVGIVGQSDYVASKHGLVGMHESVSTMPRRAPPIHSALGVVFSRGVLPLPFPRARACVLGVRGDLMLPNPTQPDATTTRR